MSAVSGKARSDDANRIKEEIVAIAKFADARHLREKTNRGFKHPATGRLLCPLSELSAFDEDPER